MALKMMSRFGGVISILCATATAIALSAETGTTAMPSAYAPAAVFEFAPVLDGVEITHDFVIRNPGEAPLEITKVQTG